MALPVDHAGAPTEQGSLLRGKRIVICEDEGITVLQLRKMLTQAGVHVVGTANNGEQGVTVVLETKPDLVLMDVNMPRMDGLEATRRILEKMWVCVAMLTAYPEYEAYAREIGAFGYILKPVNVTSLLPQLEAAYRACQSRTQ